MKKYIAILIILNFLLLSLLGCGNWDDTDFSGSTNDMGNVWMNSENLSTINFARITVSNESTTEGVSVENKSGETLKDSDEFQTSKDLSFVGEWIPVRLLKEDGSLVYCYLDRSEFVEYLNSHATARYLDYNTVLSDVSKLIGQDFLFARPFFKNGLAVVSVFFESNPISTGDGEVGDSSADNSSSGENLKDEGSSDDVFGIAADVTPIVLINRDGDIISQGIYSSFENWDERYIIGVREDSHCTYYDVLSGSGEVVKTLNGRKDIEKMKHDLELKDGKNAVSSFGKDYLDREMKQKYLYTKYLGNGYYYGGLLDPEWNSNFVEYFKYTTFGDSDFEGGIRKAVIKDGEQIGGFDYFSLIHVKDDLFYVGDGTQNYFYDFKLNSAMHQKKDLGILTDFDVYQDLIVCTDKSQAQVFITPNQVYVNHDVGKIPGGYVYMKFIGNRMCYMVTPVLVLENEVIERHINEILEENVNHEFALCPHDGDDFRITRILSFIHVKGFLLQIRYDFYQNILLAAHPSHFQDYRIYDIEEGKRVMFEDLFTDVHGVKSLILGELKAQYEQRIGMIDEFETKDLSEFFHLDRLSNKIYFTKGKMNIVYSPYEVASYAQGYIEMQIDLKQLEPFMKEKYYQMLCE